MSEKEYISKYDLQLLIVNKCVCKEPIKIDGHDELVMTLGEIMRAIEEVEVMSDIREKNKRKLAEILLSLNDFVNDVLCTWWCTGKCPYRESCDDDEDCRCTEGFKVDDVLKWMEDVGVD